MQNVSELFKDMISPYIDENGLTLALQPHGENSGFRASITDKEKEVCSITVHCTDLISQNDERASKVIGIYADETIKQLKSNKGG